MPRKIPKALVRESSPAERLEYVRKEKGYESLMDFWKALTADGYEVSYEAVRRYHTDREPPAHYYARVADLTGIRLEWLIRGGSAVLHWERDYVSEMVYLSQGGDSYPFDSEATRGALLKKAPFVGQLDSTAQEAFARTWRRFARARGDKGMPLDIGLNLAEMLSYPFEMLEKAPDLASSRFSDYALMLLDNLMIAVRLPTKNLKKERKVRKT